MTKQFKPLLAHTIEDTGTINYPCMASCKLDGIRCIVIDGVAYSRSLKPIRNKHVQACIGKPEYNGLDGELIVGDPFAADCYRVTNSGVMSEDGEPDFTFHVFDRIDMDAPFEVRFSSLPYKLPHAQLVPHWLIKDEDHLLEVESELLAKGAEGVMIRSLDGCYKQGRSTTKEGILGKLKRMETAEAEIVGVIELKHNMNEAKTNELGYTERSTHKENKVAGGVMGAITVRCVIEGCEFQIGTGFTAEDRKWFWENRLDVVGKVVSYSHFPVGRKDLPRHPSFKGFRSKEDM